jgi:hypothetical protein
MTYLSNGSQNLNVSVFRSSEYLERQFKKPMCIPTRNSILMKILKKATLHALDDLNGAVVGYADC